VSLTGKESLPVKKLNRLKNDTRTNNDSLPEPVTNRYPNDSLTTHKRPKGENTNFSLPVVDVKSTLEKPVNTFISPDKLSFNQSFGRTGML
jgi:hypothetical protein